MKYIMSGARGMIGEKLKQRLDKKGDEMVLELDQRAGSNILSLDSYQLTPSTQQTDIFFHLGAFCKINETIKTPRLSHYNNANGTFEALEFCRKNNIKKFVYMSSSRVLSKERNPYVASKLYGEELCKAYKDCYGIDYIIIRPSTVYGEHHDLTTRLITKWIINALSGKPLLLFGDRNKTLDFTHVDDFVGAVMLLTEKWDRAKNEAYNISGASETNLLGLGKMITEMAGGGRVVMHPPETAQPQQVKLDISDIQALGYSPKRDVISGVHEMLKFYRSRE